MTAPAYPFTAIVGQSNLKLALLLASVDWRLSVLLKGDKGSGKSTAARGLSEILPVGAPFVNLPIGATEDRLLGGLDLGQALQGHANLKRGLIHEAHGGVLYIDEVNLLSDALTDALLDVASSGRHYLERDGFSASAEAKFVLLGSMNLEEGALRPQLLDRFALSLDVEAPSAPEDRALIVDSRLRFDSDPVAFRAAHEEEQQRLREAIVESRSLTVNIKPSLELLQTISQSVTKAGVRSLRADLAGLRAAIAYAALDGRVDVTQEDVELVLPLVLHHRSKAGAGQTPPTPPPSPLEPPREQQEESGGGQAKAKDRVFPTQAREASAIGIGLADNLLRGRTAAVMGATTGKGVSSNNAANGETLDILASFKQSFRNIGKASLNADQLIFRSHAARSGVRFIFVVDASGSHAVRERMSAVKGVAAALLKSSVDNRDEIAVISFRGAKAEIVLEPCRDVETALRVLEFLPTGGRTPLAHALELSRSLLNPASVLILLTDGRANVPLTTTDPWGDALEVASRLGCPALLVDSSIDSSTAGATEALAAAMGARLIRLDDLNKDALMSALQR